MEHTRFMKSILTVFLFCSCFVLNVSSCSSSQSIANQTVAQDTVDSIIYTVVDNNSYIAEQLHEYAPQNYSCGYVITDFYGIPLSSIFLINRENNHELAYNKTGKTVTRGIQPNLAESLYLSVSKNIVHAVTQNNNVGDDIFADGYRVYAVTPESVAYWMCESEDIPDNIWLKECPKFEVVESESVVDLIIKYAPQNYLCGYCIQGPEGELCGIFLVKDRKHYNLVLKRSGKTESRRIETELAKKLAPSVNINVEHAGTQIHRILNVMEGDANIEESVFYDGYKTYAIFNNKLAVYWNGNTGNIPDAIWRKQLYSFKKEMPEPGDTISGVVKDVTGPMMMVNVAEKDSTGHTVSSAITDMNGYFSFRVLDPQNRLTINYVGYKDYSAPIDRLFYEINMENDNEIPLESVKSTGIPIPLE